MEAPAERVELPIANTSQHLRVMHRDGLLASRRDGKRISYRHSDPSVVTLTAALCDVAERNSAEVHDVILTLSVTWKGDEGPRTQAHNQRCATAAKAKYRNSQGRCYQIDMPAGHQHHGHSHGAGHDHGRVPESYDRAFAIGVSLNLAFVAAEVVFGFAANSLALLADAAHNLSDVAGLVLAWGAAWLGRRKPTSRRTYGFRRASILAALLNAALLLVGVGGILVESIRRFGEPEPIAGMTVIWVATIGILINGGTALLFMRGRDADLNIRGAFLHMAADAGVSLGVVLATLAERATGWLWLDPATGVAIALVILYGTWGLGRDSVNLAFDATPAGIDPDAVKRFLEALPGVVEVHDLHIWAMSTTETALTVHLVRPGTVLDDAFIADVAHQLDERFAIHHATIQIESGDPAHPCRLAPAEVV